jgi:hypothetical protein
MDELVAFLRAVLDEEAAAAGALARDYGDYGWSMICASVTAEDMHGETEDAARHIARWDPARVLAEVEAKRALIDYCYPTRIPALQNVVYMVILHLAQPYASRPGFRDEWRLT